MLSSLKGWGTLFGGPSQNIQDVLGTFRGPYFIRKFDAPKTFSERPCWCQGRRLVTSLECSETVTMLSSLKGWGMLFGGPSQNIQDVLGTFRGPYFIRKFDVPKTFSERPCWCQGHCLVTSLERSETVTMLSSLKGWGTLFGGPSQNIQDVLGTFRGPYFI